MAVSELDVLPTSQRTGMWAQRIEFNHGPLGLTLVALNVLVLLGRGTAAPLDQVLQYIDDHQNDYIEHLKQWVAIQGESASAQKRNEVIRMMEVVGESIRQLGGTAELVNVGMQQLPNGETIQLPPVALGELGKDPSQVTVCVYGHADVQPAGREDGWATDPYVLTERDGNLYGRGASDDKGPVLAWFHAIGAFQALNQELPVNIKFVFEGMEESGSKGLPQLLHERIDTFFSNVDYVVISDSGWLGKKPAITYGTRRNCYFFVEVKCAKQDLHSGLYGGTVHEAMTDLIAILDSLVNSSGHIVVPGINKAVAPLKEEECSLYEGIYFDLEIFKNNIGTTKLLYASKENVLLHRWRYPSLSIHGIEGAFSSTGTKTVIPAKVIGKFSIRLVPDMDPANVTDQVTEYLHQVFTQRKSPNKMKVTVNKCSKAWVGDVSNRQYAAGRRAIKKVYGMTPDLIREGGSIPIARTFQRVTMKSVMMLPIGGADDGVHSQNEKISRENYINDTKLLAMYFAEISQQL